MGDKIFVLRGSSVVKERHLRGQKALERDTATKENG